MANTIDFVKGNDSSLTFNVNNAVIPSRLVNPTNIFIEPNLDDTGVVFKLPNGNPYLSINLGDTVTQNGDPVTNIDTLALLFAYANTLLPEIL